MTKNTRLNIARPDDFKLNTLREFATQKKTNGRPRTRLIAISLNIKDCWALCGWCCVSVALGWETEKEDGRDR